MVLNTTGSLGRIVCTGKPGKGVKRKKCRQTSLVSTEAKILGSKHLPEQMRLLLPGTWGVVHPGSLETKFLGLRFQPSACGLHIREWSPQLQRSVKSDSSDYISWMDFLLLLYPVLLGIVQKFFLTFNFTLISDLQKS